MASLIPGPITITWGVWLPPIFHGRVFGKLRSLRGWHFLYGQRFMGRSLHWIILCLGGAFWWIGVVCAIGMRKLWIISSSIVLLLTLSGFICFRSLGPNGSCQALWKAWCIVGVIGWVNLIQTFGIWFLAIWCGLFGWKEIGTLLRIPRNPWLNYKLYARSLYLIGLGVGAPRIVPLSWSLFLLLVLHFKFFLVVCLFVAFPCVHHHEHLVFAFFYFTVCLIILLLPIKKKKRMKAS